MNITRTSDSAASYEQKRKLLNKLGHQSLTAADRRTYGQMIRCCSSGGADDIEKALDTLIQQRTVA